MTVDDVIIAFVIGAFLTIAQAVMLVVALNKTGLSGKWVLSGFAPVVALAGQSYLVFAGIMTPAEATVLTAPFWLLPYTILAFKSWPGISLRGPLAETPR